MTELQKQIAKAESRGWSITLNPQGRFPLSDEGWTLRKDGNGVTEFHLDSYNRESIWKAVFAAMPEIIE